MNNRLFAYADLPRTGLCNMLNPWARAVLWARANRCGMLAPNWVKVFRIGPWLRRENDKRYYFHQFTNEGYIGGIKKWMIFRRFDRIREESLTGTVKEGIIVFSSQKNDILDLLSQAEFLKQELFRIAAPDIKSGLKNLPREFIGVHIRRGDFKAIGQVLSADYYCSAITHAIKAYGDIPILVCSDAPEVELPYLRRFPNLNLLKDNPALQDVLILSEAKCLVCTNGSSFSEWAAFLGGMHSVWSKDGRAIDEKKFTGEISFV